MSVEDGKRTKIGEMNTKFNKLQAAHMIMTGINNPKLNNIIIRIDRTQAHSQNGFKKF